MKIDNRNQEKIAIVKIVSLFAVFSLCYGCGDMGGDSGDKEQIYSISGQVTSNGSGLSGVTVTGITTAPEQKSAQTDASGNYTFTKIWSGDWTITPSKTGFAFSPKNSYVSITGTSKTGVNFTATPAPYSISGKVTLDGIGLSGVTVALREAIPGAISTTTATDASGNYTFTDLVNGSYIITPQKTGFTFSPPNSQQTVSGADITAVNFTATPGPFSISGKVTWNGTGLQNVTISLSGDRFETTGTNSSGNYTLYNITNGDYTITPSKAGFSFSPTSSQQTVSGANITAVNFTVTSGPSAQIVSCPPTGTTNVTIQDNVFTPQNITISTNGIVRWIFNGPSLHIVLSGTTPTPDNKFNIGSAAIGQWVCVQFYETGTYPYFCTIHPTMTGFVTVQ